MLRTSQSQSVHDKIIGLQVNAYSSKGYTNIKASHIGYLGGQPDIVNGHIPDLSSYYNGQKVICEVETADSISNNETIEQLKAFSRSGYILHVSIPKSELQQAQKVARDNGINVNLYWTTEI